MRTNYPSGDLKRPSKSLISAGSSVLREVCGWSWLTGFSAASALVTSGHKLDDWKSIWASARPPSGIQSNCETVSSGDSSYILRWRQTRLCSTILFLLQLKVQLRLWKLSVSWANKLEKNVFLNFFLKWKISCNKVRRTKRLMSIKSRRNLKVDFSLLGSASSLLYPEATVPFFDSSSAHSHGHTHSFMTLQ